MSPRDKVDHWICVLTPPRGNYTTTAGLKIKLHVFFFFLKTNSSSSVLASGHVTTVLCFPDAVASRQLAGSRRSLLLSPLRVRCRRCREQKRDMYTRTAVKEWAEPREAFPSPPQLLGTSEMTRFDLRCRSARVFLVCTVSIKSSSVTMFGFHSGCEPILILDIGLISAKK